MGDVSYLPDQPNDNTSARPSAMFPDGFSLTPLALRAHPDADLALIGFYTRLWELADRRTRRIDGLSLRELAAALLTARSTTARYLDRLIDMGFIYKEDRGRGRGNKASYILLPKLIEHSPTPSGKSPTDSHLTAEKSHEIAPSDRKSPAGGTHLGPESPAGGTHLAATPLLRDREEIEEQVRTSKMDRCKRCADAHRRIFDRTKFANARKRFQRTIAAAAFVQVVFLTAHPGTNGAPATAWGLLYTLAKCYQLPHRGECTLEQCPHGRAALTDHRGRRQDAHTTAAAAHERRTYEQPTGPVVQLTMALAEQLAMPDPDDLDARRRALITQLRAMEDATP